ncbi:MAG TPA: gamma-glutamylcyclotransferase family protein [Opitutus sp.]|nr:gamma-glutamylcyclotransferase family protein [Opitutus sp.]
MPPETSPILLFIYGTLKRGCSNHRVLAGQTFLGEARTAPGYRLYDLGEYPGMIAVSGDHQGVSGELWSVTPEILAQLDAFEGIPQGLYRRERIALRPPFADRTVNTYFYNLSVLGRPELTHGTWTEK